MKNVTERRQRELAIILIVAMTIGCVAVVEIFWERPIAHATQLVVLETPPAGCRPVYRFWSPRISAHFYTISEVERDYLLRTYGTETWTYEGIAFYAWPAPPIVEGGQP